jgi:glycosyltransferase involved in cell wall biosynthesis
MLDSNHRSVKIAYLANCFPSPVEPYVMDEVARLRAEGMEVLASSARRVGALPRDLASWSRETLYLQATRLRTFLWSLVRCGTGYRQLRPFLLRIISGDESLVLRGKALLHTWLGVYYASLLEGKKIDHIHLHHGYFSSWVAMVAARLLGITYSMTLHGSDLLVKAAYLDIKLERCSVCFTISEYNRKIIFQRYPQISHDKVLLRRLGVEVPERGPATLQLSEHDHRFVVLVPGRLHAIKNHSFLITACAALKTCGFDFVCFLAGDGPERRKIEKQIRTLSLEREIKLLGHVVHEDLNAIYPLADLVVLTSKSEGIPVVLMEAMAHGCAVLAPNITGIPELVIDGETGILYEAGSVSDFVSRVLFVQRTRNALGPLRRAAREHVRAQFNRGINLEGFVKALCANIPPEVADENSVLQ